jgi:hypothetical protein
MGRFKISLILHELFAATLSGSKFSDIQDADFLCKCSKCVTNVDFMQECLHAFQKAQTASRHDPVMEKEPVPVVRGKQLLYSPTVLCLVGKDLPEKKRKKISGQIG